MGVRLGGNGSNFISLYSLLKAYETPSLKLSMEVKISYETEKKNKD